jgi:cardiolipin synthase
MALKTAAVSGVDVRIILPSVPDTKIVRWASLSYLEEMLQSGVRVYEYNGFIHAKVLIIDQMLASVGTANMDMRSFFSNFELNALLFDRVVIDRLQKDFGRDLEHSREIVLEEFVRRPKWQKMQEMLSRMLSPLF